MTLDLRRNAVRGDLADVRLADKVFAPHYAAPMACVVSRGAALFETRERGPDPLADLAAGEPFEVLELAGGNAWGRAPAHDMVGYVDRRALELAA